MSALRHRFRVVLDGVPYEIVTSARDQAAVDIDADAIEAGDARARATATWQVLHAAMQRLDIPGVPGDLDKFVDLLDDLDDLDPDEAATPDPTRPAG
jgi:hypothetical protein